MAPGEASVLEDCEESDWTTRHKIIGSVGMKLPVEM